MLLNFEGPRGIGKTTLINRVEKACKLIWPNELIVVFDYDPEPREMLEAKLLDYVTLSRNMIIIHDRFHFSEWVYSQVLNRRPLHELTLEVARIETRIMEVGNCRTFTLMTDEDTIIKRQKQANKEFDIPVQTSIQKFCQATMNFSSGCFIDATNDPLPQVMREVMKCTV